MVTSCASCLPASSMLIVVMERLCFCTAYLSRRGVWCGLCALRMSRISRFACGWKLRCRRKLRHGDKCGARCVYNLRPERARAANVDDDAKRGHGGAVPLRERGEMGKSRREFLGTASAGLIAALTAADMLPGSLVSAAEQDPTKNGPAGAPSAYGAGPAFGPEVSTTTFSEAEKLVQISLNSEERTEAAESWRVTMAALYERRVGPRKVPIEASVAPYSQWNPVLPGQKSGPERDVFVRSKDDEGAMPSSDEAIAYAPVSKLSRWIERRKLSSERLTNIYLERIQKFDPKLRCVITVPREHAIARAKQADAEIAAGKYRGALHGIPYGVKDLLDTAGIRTTWGAEFYRDRVPATDSAVVKRLNDAGAVLIAKLSLGALALNDIWFGGQTMKPWLLEEGASGSSAGPGAATAAGLVGFAIGSETGGSIVAPSMRCGITGLRPTFGRVPRTGAMTLCWSLDKLGPMARGVEDTLLVLQAISGSDGGDVDSVPSELDYDAQAKVVGLRVGYFPDWMREATAVDRAALETIKNLGMQTVEVSIPDW